MRLNNVNNIAAVRVSQAMQGVQARVVEIEDRTGLTFSAYMRRSQVLQSAGRDAVAEAYKLTDEALKKSESALSAPEENAAVTALGTGAFTRLEESDYDELFAEAAERYGIHAALIKAVCFAESNFRPDVVSKAGAMGLMQLMPYTADALGVDDPFDPAQSVDGGARLLAQNLELFDGNALLAVAAYNCGRNGVTSRGVTDLSDLNQRELLPAETRGYLARIESYLGAAQALYVLDDPYAA